MEQTLIKWSTAVSQGHLKWPNWQPENISVKYQKKYLTFSVLSCDLIVTNLDRLLVSKASTDTETTKQEAACKSTSMSVG